MKKNKKWKSKYDTTHTKKYSNTHKLKRTKLACPHEYKRLKDENESRVDDIPDCLLVLSEKEKYMFCINYRGKPIEKLAHSFKKLNAPCRVIMKTRKLKTALPSLKPTIPKMLRSSVVYKIDCPGCDASYIGETLRLLQQSLREHLRKSGTTALCLLSLFGYRYCRF